MIPNRGNARNGTKAVAVSGSASVIHQIAISTMIAVVRHAAGGMPPGAGSSSISANAASPPQSPQRAVMLPPRIFAGDAMPGRDRPASRSGAQGDQRDLPAIGRLALV